MAIFGHQGIRDAMIASYQKHVELARTNGAPAGSTPHECGMYGAFATRCRLGLRGLFGVDETQMWMELMPFMPLEPDAGLAALAEYIVYKESPKDADYDLLDRAVLKGLRMLDEDTRASILSVARAKKFRWFGFALKLIHEP